MRNLEFRSEDVLVLSEFRLSEIKKIRFAMDHVTVAMDLTNEEQRDAHRCFTKTFMEWLDGTIASVENG